MRKASHNATELFREQDKSTKNWPSGEGTIMKVGDKVRLTEKGRALVQEGEEPPIDIPNDATGIVTDLYTPRCSCHRYNTYIVDFPFDPDLYRLCFS